MLDGLLLYGEVGGIDRCECTESPFEVVRFSKLDKLLAAGEGEESVVLGVSGRSFGELLAVEAAVEVVRLIVD